MVSAPRLPEITDWEMLVEAVFSGDEVSALTTVDGGFKDAAANHDGVIATIGLNHRASAQIALDTDGVSSISGGIKKGKPPPPKMGCSFCERADIDGVVSEVTGQVRTRKCGVRID